MAMGGVSRVNGMPFNWKSIYDYAGVLAEMEGPSTENVHALPWHRGSGSAAWLMPRVGSEYGLVAKDTLLLLYNELLAADGRYGMVQSSRPPECRVSSKAEW